MRNSYTVTLPEEPPVSPFPGMPRDLRTKTSMPGSLLVSTFVGLVLNKTKCFMNSILQCLSNTKELRDYCLQNQYVRDLNNNSRMQMALMAEFAKLIQALWTSSPNESVSPSEFKTQIQRYAPRFVGYNEVNRVLVRPKGSSDNLDHLPDEEKGRQMWMKYLAREDSRIGAFDPFWDLSLPIAKKSYGEVNLIDCMRLFTKEDILDGDEKPVFFVFLNIFHPDLKRFSEARMRSSKLTTFVNFPLKDLDLREFASQSCSEYLGKEVEGMAIVTPLSSSHVRSSDAYLLFYELASPSSRM
ncbi:hypothetical protein JD844_031504 [Phrynosoma platyrhinos]|uniref:ubiquitinyl hydrolase 1 n=1 Tax=Phrynosoma platyrhinos TaxID=52577 RepID=A0ABQ7T150_PHRPL|nr:hypothetical protein JD844_031504 [Phrynosoma platyrhinos]